MPTPSYLQISSPGQLPKVQVGFHLLDGDVINPAEVTIGSSLSDYLSADDIAVSAEIREIDGVEFPAGSVIEFTLICADGAPQADNRSPHYVHIDYRTFGDSIPERLRWTKRCDVFPRLPLD